MEHLIIKSKKEKIRNNPNFNSTSNDMILRFHCSYNDEKIAEFLFKMQGFKNEKMNDVNAIAADPATSNIG